MQLQEILAEKIAAMSQRSKGRDLFDIWFVIDKTEIRKDILDQKLSGEIELEFPDEEEYSRDLSDLVARPPQYTRVREAVRDSLEEKGILA